MHSNFEILAPRERALKRIASATDAEHIIAWFAERRSDSTILIASHYFVENESLRKALRNQSIVLQFTNRHTLFIETADLELRITIESLGINPDTIQCGWLWQIDSAGSSAVEKECVGVVTYFSSRTQSNEISAELSAFLAVIEMGRSRRIVTAVTDVQNIIRSNTELTLDATLCKVGAHVRTALKCNEVFYRNRNTSMDWSEISGEMRETAGEFAFRNRRCRTLSQRSYYTNINPAPSQGRQF